jgi:heavy metal sensor kinase
MDPLGPGPGPPGERRFGPPRESGPREFHPSAEVLRLFDEAETNGFYYAVWSRSGALLQRSTNAPPGVSFPDRLGDSLIHIRVRGAVREAFHFTERADCVLAGRSIAGDLAAMHRFAWWLVAAGGAVLALGLSGSWLLATRAIWPVEEISAAASRISAGNLSERITVAEPENELGRLAGVLNSAFGRLEAAFARQKQFTADASHELRTPLAVLISEAQTTLARERTAAEYRETVEACLDTAQQMRRLTESLLELARSDAGGEAAKCRPTDIAELIRDSVEQLAPLADERHARIEAEVRSTLAVVNPDRMRQVLTNLITNAIHYNKPGGEVRVGARAEAGRVVVEIADTGVGISAGDLPHIFERFYRADKSRSAANGHFGLGLAICKAIVEADGGQIRVSSSPGVGTTVTLELPAPAPA